MVIIIITANEDKPSASCTFQRVSCESQLADDVTWNVRFDALALFGVSFSGLQKVVELLRVKLLQTFERLRRQNVGFRRLMYVSANPRTLLN